MAKPLDEAVRRGGPLELELELVDRCPEAFRDTQWSWHSAVMNLQPHIAMVEAEDAAA